VKRVLLFFAFLLALALPSAAHAHAMRSAFVEIDEVSPGRPSVHVKSAIPEAAESLSVEIEGCMPACSELAGHEVIVRGIGPVVDEAVVWVRFADGTTSSHVVSRDDAAWTLPAQQTAFAVARQYVALGVKHIATGYDHLLFLFLLVLVVRRVRGVFLAETAFTLSHSISFTATALGWIRVSAPLAEACIALSLVLVALDAADPKRTSRNATGLAFLFGLVHGLGFAGGLREIGLPEHDVATALVGFGAGVEIGQVAFLVVVLLFVRFARRARSWPRIAIAGAYASGTLATFWLVERALDCVKGAS
jgi:hydrogenase/urease accessory protein HupE